jgi:hypothetical protein
MLYVIFSKATRREEVCGIRAKFPTKIPVSIQNLQVFSF